MRRQHIMNSYKLALVLVAVILLVVVPASATITNYTSSGTSDGLVERNGYDVSWVNIRNGDGTSSGTTEVMASPQIKFGDYTGAKNFAKLQRAVILIDTSGLPDNATINNATLYIYVYNTSTTLGSFNYGVTGINPVTAGIFGNAEYQLVSDTRYATDLTTPTTPETRYSFPLNSIGLTNISKIGYTNLSIRSAPDIDNTTTGITEVADGISALNFATSENTSYKPYLSINHTDPTIANFTANITYGDNSLDVLFTDSSINSPTAWNWYWYANETVSSTSQNSTTTFTPGFYSVRLYAANSLGGSWLNRTSYIAVSSGGKFTFHTTNTTDGWVFAVTSEQAYAPLRVASSTLYSEETDVKANARIRSGNGTTPDMYNELGRMETFFDTSLIPDSARLLSAKLSLKEYYTITSLGTAQYGVTGVSPGISDGVIRSSDYPLFGNVRYADTDITPSAGVWNNWSFNAAGLANISKTSWTNLMIRQKWDISNDTTGLTWAPAENYTQTEFSTAESGASTTPILEVEFTLAPPVANFVASPLSGGTPMTVHFTDTSLYGPTSWSWAYKNATVGWTQFSTAQNPNQVFFVGVYDINLTATSDLGTDSEIKSGYITVGTPAQPKIYPLQFINETKILPNSDTNLPPEGLSLSINATPDEYDPASFVIKPNGDVNDMQVFVSVLSDGVGHTIPASATDVRTVKVWYQADDNDIWVGTIGYYLTPELLLKDDNLINVDYATQQQTILLHFSNGTSMCFHIDNTTIGSFPDDAKIFDNATITGDIQPFALPANENKQIWMTTHVPAGQVAGNYTGTINVSSSDSLSILLNYTVRVLPFTLVNSTKTYGLFYYGSIPELPHDPYILGKYPFFKTEDQYTAEMADMKNHGILYPQLSGYREQTTPYRMETQVRIRNESGLPQDKIFFGEENLIPYDPDIRFTSSQTELNDLASYTLWMKNITATYGFGTNYALGADEPNATEVTLQRQALTTVKTNGSLIWQSSDGETTLSNADLLDVINLAGSPQGNEYNSTLLNIWKSANPSIKVFSYANPQAGVENFELYRESYGVRLWRSGYDGEFTFMYMDNYGQSIWNDFDNGNNAFRDHVFAYPKSDGVIDTIQWEGMREAVDDSRYADTLTNLTGSNTSALSIINAGIAAGSDMSIIRAHIIDHILVYNGSFPGQVPVAHFYMNISGTATPTPTPTPAPTPTYSPGSTLYLTDWLNADGSDETAELQAAFDYAAANSKTFIVFPTGEKTIGINEMVTTPLNVELVGNGCTIKVLDNSDIPEESSIIIIEDGTYTHDLTINGNKDNQAVSHNGVYLIDNNRFTYNEVFNVGAYMVGTYKGDNMVISNNSFHDSNQYCVGLSGDGYDCYSYPDNCVPDDYSNNITITNNTFYSCGQVAIKIRQASDVLVKWNTITLPTGSEPTGIRLYSFDGANDGISILNNDITGTGGSSDVGIYSDESHNYDITISNNHITTTDIGITLNFDAATVLNNIITYYSECIQDNGSGSTKTGNSCTAV